MIYALNETKGSKVPEKNIVDGKLVETGGEIETCCGEWELKELWNFETVAKIYRKHEADYILELLNNSDNPKFQMGDLVQLSMMIRQYLKEWVAKYPDGVKGSYRDAVDFTIGKIMQKCEGQMNPSVVKQLVFLERTPFDGTNYILPLPRML